MASIHYCAAWAECGCFVVCGHSHASVSEAVPCIRSAGAYVVAVDAGTMRSLNGTEEAEFQFMIHGSPAAHVAADDPTIAAVTAIDSHYAVMTPIRVGGHWRWTTWLCFETHAEASAHAREGDKVVRFRSAEWQALRRQTTIAPPSRACADTGLAPRSKDESVVEFVFRFLGTCEFEENPDLGSKARQDSLVSEGIQDDDSEERKRA